MKVLNNSSFASARSLGRAELKNVLGGELGGPGDCKSSCGAGAETTCTVDQPYCNTVDCVDKSGNTVSVKHCYSVGPGGE